VHAGVAGDLAQRGGVEREAIQRAAGTTPEEVGEVDDDVEVGAVAAAEGGVLVVEEVSADVDEGVGAAFGGGLGVVADGVGGLGEPEGGADHVVGFGVEVGVEAAPPVEGGGQVQLAAGFGVRRGVVQGVEEGFGPGLPVLQEPDRVGDRLVLDDPQDRGFVVGEEGEGAGGDDGDDGVDLAAGEGAGPVGPGHAGQVPEPAGGGGLAGGLAAGHPGMDPQPRRHRR
jgi:hypothetical protein